MNRVNGDLLRKALDTMFTCLRNESGNPKYSDAFADFIWYLSVARQAELDDVYEFLIDNALHWDLPTEVSSIFGRVYAASLQTTNPEKAVKVAFHFLLPFTTPVEWNDVVNVLSLQTEERK